MKARKIEEYLPNKEKKVVLLVEVETDLRDRVKKLKGEISWRDLIEGLLKRYLDETNGPKKFKTKE